MPLPHDPDPPEDLRPSGPAWTRVTAKPTRSRPPGPPVWPPQLRRSPASDPALAHAAHATHGPAATAPAGPPTPTRPYGTTGAGASTVSLPAQPLAHYLPPPPPVERDAPYLTHVARHHGHLTLVAPDNLGARRQPGTRDPPDQAIDARGSWGVPSYSDDADAHQPQQQQPKIKKRSDKARKKEREERQRRERVVASAVANAGRTPSPSPGAGAPQLAAYLPSPAAAMARGKSGGSLEVPGQREPQRRKKSRERAQGGEGRSAGAAEPGASSISLTAFPCRERA